MAEEYYTNEEILITRHLAGEATHEEERRLQDWIAISEENKSLFAQMKRAYELGGQYNPRQSRDLKIDVEEEWNRFEQRVENDSRIKAIPSSDASGFSLWKIAAALLLIVSSGLVINYFVQQNKQVTFTASSRVQRIVLPDGTHVSLNRNSELSYDPSFGKEMRAVTLSGEAFFDVQPDPHKRFVIAVGEAEVSVLGTSFNVQGYEDQQEVEIVVETGVVKLKAVAIDEGVELRAGEKGVYRKNRQDVQKQRNNDINYLAWKTGKIIFEKMSLVEVIGVLMKVYDVEIVLPPTLSPDCEVTVTFEGQSLEAVLAVLESTLDLTYQREGNKIVISKAGC